MVFPPLSGTGIVHGVFDRRGGTSAPPWDSMNVGFGLGDGDENVRENRNRIKRALGLEKLVSAKQVHGSTVYALTGEPPADLAVAGCDGLLTDIPGLGLMIQQADCQAVLLHDHRQKAVGIVHVGWRGTVHDIINKSVLAMQEAFGTRPADLKAAISPSLGPCCAEFIHYQSELPAALHAYQVRPNYFDFWAISWDQLLAAGLRQERIWSAGICTACTPSYFSYRRDKTTGRFASVIGLCT